MVRVEKGSDNQIMRAKNGRIRLALGSARTTDPFLGLAHLIQASIYAIDHLGAVAFTALATGGAGQ